jgi:hypothetical protein
MGGPLPQHQIPVRHVNMAMTLWVSASTNKPCFKYLLIENARMRIRLTDCMSTILWETRLHHLVPLTNVSNTDTSFRIYHASTTRAILSETWPGRFRV